MDDPDYKALEKLKDKVVFITGGDSVIGKATAILFAKEGAKIEVVYLNEEEDAQNTKRLVKQYGSIALLIKEDISKEDFYKKAVEKTIDTFKKIDVLVNNAAEQHTAKSIEKIETKNLVHTYY